MPTHPAVPLSPRERDRLRARFLSDQADASRQHPDLVPGRDVPVSVLVVAYALVVVFLLCGGYAAAAATGLVPAMTGSALATSG